MTEISYIVEGHWPFPVDMLRHDGSRAATQTDQDRIDALSTESAADKSAFNVDVQINLVGPSKPNVERWKSFSWKVPFDEVEMERKRERESRRLSQRLIVQALAKLTDEERDAVKAAMGWHSAH
jgi:hypothetical protein